MAKKFALKLWRVVQPMYFVYAAILLSSLMLYPKPLEAGSDPVQEKISRFEVDFEQRALWYSMSNFNGVDSNQSYWIRWETGEQTSTTLDRMWTSSESNRVVCYHPPGRYHTPYLYYITEEAQKLCIENGHTNQETPHTAFYLNQPYGPTRLALAGESEWLALNYYHFNKNSWQLAVYDWKDLKNCIYDPVPSQYSNKDPNVCETVCTPEGCRLSRFYTVQSGPVEYLVREHFEADIGLRPNTEDLRVVYQLGIPEEKSKTVDETLRLVEIPADEEPAIEENAEEKRDLSKRPFVEIGENDPQFKHGWKGHPRFSPNGKWLAFLATKELHDESAETELLVIPASGSINELATAIPINITSQMNRPVTNFQWSCNSNCILFQVSSQGNRPVYQANLDLKTGKWVMPTMENPVVSGVSTVTQFQASKDGLELFVLNSSLSTPPSIVRLKRYGPWDTGHFDCGPKTVTEHCQTVATTPHDLDSVIAHKESVPAEDSSGHPVDYFVVRSREKCSASADCPLVVRVHGGPNGLWESAFDSITYSLANSGYVVLLPNPTGSIGFGQRYTDAVKKQWGGAAVDDVVGVINQAINLPYVDPDRVYGMGNSYGGYMMNYFLVGGHNEAKIQPQFSFNAIVTVNGVWDLRAFACETDQPWFAFDQLGFAKGDDECNNSGIPVDFSPVDKFENLQNIPTLIVYSKKDKRVDPETQNQALYNLVKASRYSDSFDVQVLPGGHALTGSEQKDVLFRALKHFEAYP